MTYYAREHTDPAGGALTITTDQQGVWITATDGDDEVTVGPFRATVLEPAGSSTRTDEPVDPDGDDTRTREHLLAEEHRLLGLEKSLRAHLSRTINRAEKAEYARDAAQAEAAMCQTSLAGQIRRAEKAEKERDEALTDAAETIATAQAETTAAVTAQEKAEQERDEARRWLRETEERLDTLLAAQPRPLAADDITDEMVTRGAMAYYATAEGDLSVRTRIRRALTAALTEPPARPEGAEELARLIATADVGEWDCGDLADALLATGRVRVTGAES